MTVEQLYALRRLEEGPQYREIGRNLGAGASWAMSDLRDLGLAEEVRVDGDWMWRITDAGRMALAAPDNREICRKCGYPIPAGILHDCAGIL